MYRYPHILLIVMARAPVSGQVKSRLARTIGHRRATAVYRNMLKARINTLLTARICPLALHVTPDGRHPLFLAMRRKGVSQVKRQTGRDLGGRMYHALRSGLTRAESVILTGADVPGISVGEIEQVCQYLSGNNDLILIPARDGGYGLLASGRTEAGLFRGVQWGSERVCSQTLRRARQRGLNCLLLGSCQDIDDSHDLPMLHELGIRCW